MSGEAGSDWINWCRLCAKDDTANSIIIGRNTSESFINAIGNFFKVYMCLEDNRNSSVLCIDCYVLICELMHFSQHVDKVQAGFETLRCMDTRKRGNTNIGALRSMLKIEQHNWSWAQVNNQAQIQVEDEDGIENEIETEFIQNGEEDQESDDMNKSVIEEKLKSIAVLKTPIEWVDVYGDFNTKRSDSEGEYANKEDDNESSVDMNDPPFKLELYDSEEEIIANQTEATESDIESEKCIKEEEVQKIKKDLVRIQNKRTKRKKKTIKGKCEICGKTFVSAPGLKNHMAAMHVHVKCYICDCCGKSVKSNAALKEHKFVHTDEKPCVCPICNAGFKNKARLRVHSQIHGEPRFGCQICGKKLQTRAIWVKHQKVHSNERRFICDICGYGCKISTTLKCHLLTHMGLRPFVCKYCGKKYANNTNCRAHIMKQHREEFEQDDEGNASTRQPVPTLDELRAMARKIAEARENSDISD